VNFSEARLYCNEFSFPAGNGDYLEIPRSAVGRIIGAGGARIQAGRNASPFQVKRL
jgi:hypothetical protein